MIRLAQNALKGSFPPLVTPFRNDGSVDYETYAELVEFHVKGGSAGIVVTGTTGEPSTLIPEERIELVKVAVGAARKRIQVVAATGTQNHADTITMTRAAEAAGVDALLIVTPYFVRPPQRGLEAYYLDLCRRTDLPVMIYHIPGRAAVNMTADTIVRIAEAAPNLAGIKHAFNDLALVSDLIARLGTEFRVHAGLEDLSFPMVCLGAHGLMNAVGNLLPGKVQALYSATAGGDLVQGRALHYELWELNQAIFFDINPIPMKYMMMRMGLLPNENHRLP
ncbi:MAG: 4-hydroxy-tetrahydrodipicolinate synthase, partial [Alphaproteobacteria bacterium]|nr:4-hydroxy-tetrahydrodipicolinate synthase [Alphaproteobacteria bacterium]